MPTEKATPTRPAATLHQHVPITGASRFIGRPMAERLRAVGGRAARCTSAATR